MKKKIDAFDYAKEITKVTAKGILITTKADKVNTMTVGWSSLGVEWNRQIFTIYVRESRFTHEQLEKNPEFTVNIPMGDFDKSILGKVGTKTGWKLDKIEENGLTLEEPEVISVPGIKEFPLTLECKVLYKKTQPLNEINIDPEFMEHEYPHAVDDKYAVLNNSPHTEYIAEIVAAYIIQ